MLGLGHRGEGHCATHEIDFTHRYINRIHVLFIFLIKTDIQCPLHCVCGVLILKSSIYIQIMITIPQMGKHDEAWMVLKHIHDTNMRARGEPERVFTVSTPRALLFIIPAAAKPLADD